MFKKKIVLSLNLMIAFRMAHLSSIFLMNYSKTICDVQVLKGFTVFAIYTAGDAVKMFVSPEKKKSEVTWRENPSKRGSISRSAN